MAIINKNTNLKHNIAGFTLVEIAIAIAILGVAMTTLIALQSRFVVNYIKDRELTRAVLVAQYIMTMIEVQKTDPEVGDTSGDLETLLEEHGYFDGKEGVETKEVFKNWKYEQTVSSIDIHQDMDKLRRVDLTIKWDDKSPDGQYKLSYFIKTK